jgi:excisionase family DNA binding protein
MTLITVQEAAERLKVTPKAVYFAIKDGKLTAQKQYGRVLVDEDQVAGYTPIGGAERPSKRKKTSARATTVED